MENLLFVAFCLLGAFLILCAVGACLVGIMCILSDDFAEMVMDEWEGLK